MNTPITIARGDGIGPEIMDATLAILKAAGAKLDMKEIVIGEAKYNDGCAAGIEDSAWDILRETGIFLKAPITTPRGGGFKSLNVTVRKTLGLYANVRPCVAYHPFVETHFPGMDMVIIRENEEDLYAGIEYRQAHDTYQCLKVLTRSGSERIIRYAFAYARANGRKKVTCMVKDNIMKLADGMFRELFYEIAKEYPEIEANDWIIDIGAAKIATDPLAFDVVVTLNLYGDIISDIAAAVTGSVGLGGSCNVGESCAMFEAIHGSAPDIAGKGIANPSGLLLGAVMMLVHIGQGDVAEKIHNAWFKTLEDGIHTGDIYKDGLSRKKVGTKDFTKAVIERLGQEPETMPAVRYPAGEDKKVKLAKVTPRMAKKKDLVGVDVYIDELVSDVDQLASRLPGGSQTSGLRLEVITSRGMKVWPDGQPDTKLGDNWRCRFYSEEGNGALITQDQILALLKALKSASMDITQTESLYHFEGVRGYSLAQGQ